MFDTAGAMMQSIDNMMNTPGDELNAGISVEESELNDMNAIGEQIKNKCKGK